ncbi:hypothetical protein TELCIR_00878 [Teladorsagia circumcincta]|uniref:Uncharacterized protein n=1 Tax=Teladorsagia circumcincta TaxID=45464 RepID=A0A2G9V3S3_TELCI|nr:hypothetical protein TELCIR_00878 [Teladorsagia circumcincta]
MSIRRDMSDNSSIASQPRLMPMMPEMFPQTIVVVDKLRNVIKSAMAQYPSPLLRLHLIQIALLAVCSAYPYVLSSDDELSDVVESPIPGLTKRAFDRIESNDFGLIKRAVAKRAFDRLDMADFGFRRKRAFDRIARAEFGLEGLRKKRAFDRLSIADFGFRKKRAFDRITGSEFGLVKRFSDASYPARDELIDELAIAIAAMGRATPVAVPVRQTVDEQK